MKKFGKKGAAVVVLVLAIAEGVLGYQRYEAAQAEEAAKVLSLSGNVDVREVSLAFRGSDRIAEILVDEGDTVKKGQVLARLDGRELELSIAKTQADIRSQQSTVEKLHNGTRSEEIAQAQQNYEQAQAAAANAQGTYARYQAIYDDIQGISRQTLDTARHDAEAKQAAAGAAQSAYEEAVNGARPEDIAIGEANLDASNQELARLEYQLSQYELRAPADGVIRSRLLQPGDMASSSTPVFKLSLLNKKWVRVYVKETDLGKVYEGQQADVYIDSQKAPIAGQVGYISGTAEFTPKTVQTDELRTALVYEVRVYVDDDDNVLRLGMPATVKIAL
ncbi:MAG: HlyD family efflux transporter periplasmic adaptor subunit [Veillonellaceae bacterium]|nr:HlyD family efflux transporter periplasmic adaptor subunit [Veillonellaceae bacterium]MDD6698786.1 HlyD family efflux transporter periplasmic adaptor subunit [Veillonellaceae bacterium]